MRVLGRFKRRHGRVERRFTSAERRMIGNLANGLVETMTGEPGPDDVAVLLRLLPAAVPGDPEASAEFASATRERLAEGKVEGARRLVADLDAAPNGLVSLDEPGAIAWMRALGDLRIALAERVGVEEVQRDVRAPQGLVYAWRTWLQGSLVEAVDHTAG